MYGTGNQGTSGVRKQACGSQTSLNPKPQTLWDVPDKAGTAVKACAVMREHLRRSNPDQSKQDSTLLVTAKLRQEANLMINRVTELEAL